MTSFSRYRGDDAPLTAMIAELAQVYALPCAEVQSPPGYRNGERRAYYAAFRMGGHVVVALHCVQIIRLAFLYYMVEDCLHVGTDIRVGILVDGECRRCMLDEKVQ